MMFSPALVDDVTPSDFKDHLESLLSITTQGNHGPGRLKRVTLQAAKRWRLVQR